MTGVFNPNLWPAWVAMAVAMLVGLNRLIDESSKFAGFFGRFGRRLHERAAARHRVDAVATEFAVAIEGAVEGARRKWQIDENEAIRALDARLASLSEVTTDQFGEIADLRVTVRCLTAYTEYEAAWHHNLLMKAYKADVGITADDIPAHMDHVQFRALFLCDSKWQQWAAGLRER